MDRILAFTLISFVCLAPLFLVFFNTRKILSPPALFSFGALILMLPQLYIVSVQEWRVEDAVFELYIWLMLACTLAFYLGYYLRKPAETRREKYLRLYKELDERKIFKVGVVVGSAGLFGAILLGPVDQVREWRGLPVYFYTLSKLVYPGLALVVFSYFKRPTAAKLAVAFVFLVVPLYQILFLGRRSAIIGLPILLFFAYMFFRPKAKVGRTSLAVGALVCLIAVYAIPFWRESFVDGRHLEAIAETPIQAVIDAYFDPLRPKTLETVDSMNLAYSHYVTNQFDWGIGIYNQLVQNYVPAGLLGAEFKQSMMAGSGPSAEAVSSEAGLEVANYTGKSGFTDVYGQFSIFAPLVFLLIGVFFRGIYDRMVYFRDEGAALILTVFAVIPATLSWSQLTVNLTLELPKIVLVVFVLTFCVLPRRQSEPEVAVQPRLQP